MTGALGDVCALDQLNPNGASGITARLIRNFARQNEQEQIVEIELLPERSEEEDEESSDFEGVRLIGKIRIRR
jgi:hypothetical protein